MKIPPIELFIIKILLFVINQGTLVKKINVVTCSELKFKKQDGKMENYVKQTEKIFEALSSGTEKNDENHNTKELPYKNDNHNDEHTFEIDEDLDLIRDIFLEFSNWILTKDDELKKKVQSKLKDKNIPLDSSLWQDFSDDEFLKMRNAIQDKLSPFIKPAIEKISGMMSKNIFNILEFFNITGKDEL